MCSSDLVQAVMDAAEVMSGDTLPEALGVSPWVILAGMGAALVGVFWLGERFERHSRGPVTAEQAVAGAQLD